MHCVCVIVSTHSINTVQGYKYTLKMHYSAIPPGVCLYLLQKCHDCIYIQIIVVIVAIVLAWKMFNNVGMVVPKITLEPHVSRFFFHASNPSAWGYRKLTSRVIWINSRGKSIASFWRKSVVSFK